MPLNDLTGFELLQANPNMKLGSNLDPKQITKREASTWPQAVAHLWRTPMPRILVAVNGGEQFVVIGGAGVQLAANPSGNQRYEIYRHAADPTTLTNQGGGWRWIPADQFLREPSKWVFDVVLCSGFPRYTEQTQFVFGSNRPPEARNARDITVDDTCFGQPFHARTFRPPDPHHYGQQWGEIP